MTIAATSLAPTALSRPTPMPTAETRPIRVLLAEDDAEVRATLADLLTALGHEVVATAAGGRSPVPTWASGAVIVEPMPALTRPAGPSSRVRHLRRAPGATRCCARILLR